MSEDYYPCDECSEPALGQCNECEAVLCAECIIAHPHQVNAPDEPMGLWDEFTQHEINAMIY